MVCVCIRNKFLSDLRQKSERYWKTTQNREEKEIRFVNEQRISMNLYEHSISLFELPQTERNFIKSNKEKTHTHFCGHDLHRLIK